jgi:hypothetical protein
MARSGKAQRRSNDASEASASHVRHRGMRVRISADSVKKSAKKTMRGAASGITARIAARPLRADPVT